MRPSSRNKWYVSHYYTDCDIVFYDNKWQKRSEIVNGYMVQLEFIAEYKFRNDAINSVRQLEQLLDDNCYYVNILLELFVYKNRRRSIKTWRIRDKINNRSKVCIR